MATYMQPPFWSYNNPKKCNMSGGELERLAT